MKSLLDSLTRIVNDEYTVKGLGKKAGNVLALPVKVKQNYKLYALLGYPMTEGNLIRSSRPGVFGKKVVLRNFAKFTRKHLCQNLFFNKAAGLRQKMVQNLELPLTFC